MKPLAWSWRTNRSSKNLLGSRSFALGLRSLSSSRTDLIAPAVVSGTFIICFAIWTSYDSPSNSGSWVRRYLEKHLGRERTIFLHQRDRFDFCREKPPHEIRIIPYNFATGRHTGRSVGNVETWDV